MVASRETQIYRKDANNLSTQEQENLLKPYLPPRPFPVTKRPPKSQPIRMFLRTQIHLFIFTVMHVLFSLYIRLRQAFHITLDRIFATLYYHHRAPELIRQDIRGLSKMPQHLSVILDLKEEEQGFAGLEKLLDDVAEISAWCAAAGIPMLSVYEKTGILKDHIQRTHRTVSSKLHSYFGRQIPSLQIQAPHVPSFLNGDDQEQSPISAGHLSILLISADDGRATLVDLTKTLTEMSQRNKLSPDDISLDLIDAEISESVMTDPDLLILFGPFVQLQGYPPWQTACDGTGGCPDDSKQPDAIINSVQPTTTSVITSASGTTSGSTLILAASSNTNQLGSSTILSTTTVLPPTSTSNSTIAEVGGSSSTQKSTIPLAVGIVAGVPAFFVALWLIWRYFIKRESAEIKEKKRLLVLRSVLLQGQQRLSQQQNSQAHGLYGVTDDYFYAGGLPYGFASDTQPASTEGPGIELKDLPPKSPRSSQQAVTHDTPRLPATHDGMRTTSPAVVSELSGQSSPPPELSPNAGRLPINRGRRQPPTMVEDVDAILPVVANNAQYGRMRPNLDNSGEERSGVSKSHVMSWMSYGEGAAGPMR
ncbi:MAG: hypothetical protein LQ352_007458 [Teloschistes flavicans]|nr:MAG: hypothetical protein LQ352_007458 [Teloschistes flavicans]